MRQTLARNLWTALVIFGLLWAWGNARAQQTPIPLPYTCDSSPPPELAKGLQDFYAGMARAPSPSVRPVFRVTWALSCSNRVPAGQLTIEPHLNEQLPGLTAVNITNIDQFVVSGKSTPELFLSGSCKVAGPKEATTCRLWFLLVRLAADFDYIASFLVFGEDGRTLAYGTGVAPVPKKN